MSKNSKWWEKSITLVDGCSPVSESCEHCWSATMASRFNKDLVTNGHFNGIIRLHPERLQKIPDRKKPTRWTIWNDLFHEKVPFDFIDKVFAVAALCPQHTLQILTKRADVALEYFLSRTAIDDSQRVDRLPQYYHIITNWLDDGESGYLGKHWDACETAAEHIDFCKPLPNIHLGVTCENQRCFNERWSIAQQIPAAKLFISFEPLLEEIKCDFGKRKPDQIIIGCESKGKYAGRPCKLEWIESLIDQADAAGVKVFVKQLSINGRVSHDPNEWPEKFRRRELI